jgi:ABC-type multidrug transport system ATPase subunit
LEITGNIDVSNGVPLKKEDVAFIYQDDSFFSQLSVRETLQLAASLRLYKDASEETIEEILRFLGLDKVADSYVGDIVTRGISGGERKRLAVACEMLGTAPALLIADEPSSGLDSFQATQVIMLLKRIAAEKNIAVVCSIHQPRSSIWNIFDDILLLGPGGHVIYHGPRSEILAYFAGIGYPCPADTNPAEFLIDLVSSDETKKNQAKGSQSESEERARLLASTFTNSPMKLIKNVSKKNLQMQLSSPSIMTERRFGVLSGPRDALYRFGLLLTRALRQTLRDNTTNIVRIGVSALLASIIGTIFGKSGGPGPLTSQAITDRVTLIAHASINVGMLSMIKALQLFKKERSIIDRERSQGRYSAFEYLVAKLTAELPLDAFVGAVRHPSLNTIKFLSNSYYNTTLHHYQDDL